MNKSFLCAVISMLLLVIEFCPSDLFSQPVSIRNEIKVKQISAVGSNSVRVKRDPGSGKLYILQNDGVINRVDFQTDGVAVLTIVYQKSDHGLSAPLGITFSKDGTLFLVGNETTAGAENATGVIVKGVPILPGSESRTWSVIAKTVEYPYGHIYNHRMSAIVVDVTGKYLIINSGARTDHGEMEDSLRETGLTSIILKIPIDGNNLLLQNDREWLRSNGFLFAEGIRNAFDFAYNGNNDLIEVENSGDRDDPEEMNWLQEGNHYGFPWRIGGNNTPQQFSPYDPKKDPLLSPYAWGGGSLYTTFSNDPTYPKPPANTTFTEPILSSGPDADKFRDPITGTIKDASDLGVSISSLTAHRSPDGIVFDKDSLLTGDLKGGAFIVSISNSSLITTLGDTGQDLLLVQFNKKSGNYSATVKKLVTGFKAPIGIELVGNILYINETGLQGNNNSPKLWSVTLPLSTTGIVEEKNQLPIKFELAQNYPNPFNPATTITFSLPQRSNLMLIVYDALGREVSSLANSVYEAGRYNVRFRGSNFASGMYFYTMTTSQGTVTKKMILIK